MLAEIILFFIYCYKFINNNLNKISKYFSQPHKIIMFVENDRITFICNGTIFKTDYVLCGMRADGFILDNKCYYAEGEEEPKALDISGVDF